MAIFKPRTPEEEAEREAAKREKEAQERQKKFEKAWTAFWAAPPGQARRAFEDGDHVFQVAFDVINTTSWVGGIMGTRATKRQADPSAVLNAICQEGWELINGDFVFITQKTQSRDFFLASGQITSVEGTVMGYYLFRRCPENQVGDSLETLRDRIWAQLGFAEIERPPNELPGRSSAQPAQPMDEPGGPTVKCPDCGQVFVSESVFLAHKRAMHG